MSVVRDSLKLRENLTFGFSREIIAMQTHVIYVDLKKAKIIVTEFD